MIGHQRGTAAQNDLLVAPLVVEIIFELLCARGVHMLSQDRDAQGAHTLAFHEPLNPSLGDHQFAHDVQGAIRPAQDGDVIVGGDGRQTAFQRFDLLVEPLGDHGHERAQEDHRARYGEDGGYHAEKGAFIVAQIARVGQAQERPP